jgi:hypothetical protein
MKGPTMTNFVAPDAAKEGLLCPLSRTFGTDNLTSHCRGEACALWRWKPRLASDPEFQSAVKREQAVLAQEDGTGKASLVFHKKAVERVMRNPEGYGVVREEGYCGLGGLPS